MTVYADTNFLTGTYLEPPSISEAHNPLTELRGNLERPLPVTWILHAEILNAFQLYVFISRTTGQRHVTQEQAAAAQSAFEEDLRRGNFLRPAEPRLDHWLALFEEMSLRHTARHGFRTYDLMHVASARLLECDTFWSFDARARRLAALEGLTTN